MLTISNRKKFIFVHIPKTGGTAVASALAAYADLPIPPSQQQRLFHGTLREARELVSATHIGDYFKFCVVRNPADWVVSLYFHHLHRPELDLKAYEFVKRRPFIDFIDFCRDELRLSQSFWITENGKDMALDRMLRFEQLQTEFAALMREKGLVANLKRENVTATRLRPEELFDGKAMAKLVARFSDDFELTGYEPPRVRNPIVGVMTKFRGAKIIAESIAASERRIAAIANGEGNAESFQTYAQKMLDDEQFSEALRFCDRVVLEEPWNARAHFQRSFALSKLGNFVEAECAARTALGLDAKLDLVHAHLGFLLAKRAAIGEAQQHLTTAISLSPQNAGHHYSLSAVLTRLGEYDTAFEHATRALQLDPSLALAHHQLGHLFLVRPDVGKAVEHFRTAVKLDPRNAGYHFSLSQGLATSNLMEAIKEAELALQLDANLSMARSLLAQLKTRTAVT